MGVDYFNCGACNRIVCDCGDYRNCEACGESFCVECFGDYDADDPDQVYEDDAEAVAAMKAACPTCSKTVISDDKLTTFLLKRLKWSRKKAEREYRKS